MFANLDEGTYDGQYLIIIYTELGMFLALRFKVVNIMVIKICTLFLTHYLTVDKSRENK